MNPYTKSETQLEPATPAETPLTDTLLLTLQGFTAAEIASLLGLRQWYQNGGSDRAIIARRLEFLRLLVKNGTIAL